MPRPASMPVATPGDHPAPSAAADGDGDPESLVSGAADLDDGAAAAPVSAGQAPKPKGKPGNAVTMTRDELQSMLSQAAAQGAAAVHRAAAAPKTSGQSEAELPDQSEIDPTKITRPTLSKQGYVVPANYGEPASAQVSQAIRR